MKLNQTFTAYTQNIIPHIDPGPSSHVINSDFNLHWIETFFIYLPQCPQLLLRINQLSTFLRCPIPEL